MNILFYTDYAISGMTGGIGRVTEILTDCFRRRLGWKVFSIYAAEAKPECARTVTDGAVCLRLHDRLGIRPGLRKNYARAVAFAEEHHIDVIIIQTSLDVVGKLRQTYERTSGKTPKIISVLHYTPGTDEFGTRLSALWRGRFSAKNAVKALLSPVYNRMEHRATVNAYRNAYRHGDALVLLSAQHVNAFRDIAGLSNAPKIVAIPNPLSFNYAMPDEELCAKEKTCLVVGRMVENPKRITSILRIWQHIETQEPGWALRIVGDGPDLPSFRNTAQDLRLRHVTFEGRQNPVEYYRRASLFLMTSAFEGFPMTLVEAQQMGCVPVVYDSFSALRDVVEDGRNGRIVADGDEEDFIKTLSGLMADAETRAQLARNAMRDCRRYSQENITQRWKELLETL